MTSKSYLPNWRELCAELLGALENKGHAHWPGGPDGHPLIEQARAALAAEPDGPAVPDSREPASVVGEPSDEELKSVYLKAFQEFSICGAEASWLAGLRAVARWAHHVPDAREMVSPADALVARARAALALETVEANG